MTSLSVSKLRADLADAINRVAYRKERVIIERQGKQLVALVPVEDLKWLEEMENQVLVEAADAALQEGGERVSWEQVKREAGLS
jgi:prevent-host-death family protein